MDVRKKLVELLSKYFDIGDSYAYNLTRVKSAFDCGTMGFDDFEEFDEETVEDIADHLIANGVTVQECKVGDVVYCLYQECQNGTKIIELEVETIEIHKDYTVLQGFIGEHCYRYLTKEIGKAVFLTKEQAEAHLPQPPKGE